MSWRLPKGWLGQPAGVRAGQPAGVRAGQPAGVRAGQPAGVRAGQVDGEVPADLARFGLGPRLARIAEMVPRGRTVADVGSDHGLLPIALVGSGRCPRAVAIDRADEPLARARRNAARFGVQVGLRKGDGLIEGEAEVAAIAGLGGRAICDLLRAPPALERIVVQPNTDFEEVRRSLAPLGWASVEECFVADDGRFFLVMAFEPAAPRTLSLEETFVGLVSSDPLFPAWASIQRAHWSRKSRSAEASARFSLLLACDRARSINRSSAGS